MSKNPFVSRPLDKKKNSHNILTRLDKLDRRTGAVPSTKNRAESLDEVASDINGIGGLVAAEGVLTRKADGSLEWGAGAANPANPTAGQTFFRTDLGLWIYYDGTQWLTTETFWSGPISAVLQAANITLTYHRVRADYAHYVTRRCLTTNVGPTNDGTNYWHVYNFAINPTLAAATSLGTVNTDADTASANTNHDLALTVTPANYGGFYIQLEKHNSPSAITLYASFYYKLIIT